MILHNEKKSLYSAVENLFYFIKHNYFKGL